MMLRDVVVYGVGSIGSMIAAFLGKNSAKNGINIHLVGRERVLSSIKKYGLYYVPFGIDTSRDFDTDTEGIFKVNPSRFNYYNSIDEVPSADVIFLTMKAYSLKESLKGIRRFFGQSSKAEGRTELLLAGNPYIFIMMNGLGLPEIISDYAPEERIIECIVNYPCRLTIREELTPKVFVQNDGGNKTLIVAPVPVKPNTKSETNDSKVNSDVSTIIDELFGNSGIDIRIPPDNAAFKVGQWKKALMNIGMNAISALTMLKVGEVLERPSLMAIVDRIIEETISIAEKEGIIYDVDMHDYFRKFARRDPDHYTSTYWDLVGGKRTEIDFFNGYIVERGKQYDIDTPANKSLLTLFHIAEKSR